MSKHHFVREAASSELIANVASFCSECYNQIETNETIFYDMKNYRYLCSPCKDLFQEQLDNKGEIMKSDNNSLFSS